jgi:hypothetical protein
MGVSRHRRNLSRRLIAQNAHLGKIHNLQYLKLKDGVIAEVKLTKVCFKGKLTAKVQSTAENVE